MKYLFILCYFDARIEVKFPGIPYAANASYARNLVEIARCSILVENHYPRKGRMR